MKIFDVWAEWCAPCRKFGPIFSALSYEFPSVEFIKVNADEDPNFLFQYKIQSIPMILIVDEFDNLLFSHAGILTEVQLRAVLNTYVDSYIAK